MINHMVNYSEPQLDTIFHALANTTRRHILSQVAERPLSVNAIAAQYEMSLPAVSKHIRVLVDSGLVTQQKDGRLRHCHLNPEPLQAASELLERYRSFWEDQLDALAEYLENEASEENGPVQ